jgi:drug/metabolite transporter (DMT)-like permease
MRGARRFDIRTAFAAAVTIGLWASGFAGIRSGLHGYGAGELALLRLLVAAVVLVGYGCATHMRLPARRDLVAVALVGALGFAGYQMALAAGERSVSAGSAGMIVNLSPVFIALLATAFLGERLRGWGWAGIAVSFGGVALIALGEGGGLRFAPGALLVLAAAAFQALHFVIQKPRLRAYRPLEFITYAVVVGAALLLPWLPGLLRQAPDASASATLAVVYLGLFPSAIGHVTWAYVLARAPASRAASWLYAVPPATLAIAWLWLGEAPAALAILGGAIALGGVALVNARGRATTPVTAAPSAPTAVAGVSASD